MEENEPTWESEEWVERREGIWEIMVSKSWEQYSMKHRVVDSIDYYGGLKRDENCLSKNILGCEIYNKKYIFFKAYMEFLDKDSRLMCTSLNSACS